MIKLFVFDLDGTLVDSLPTIAYALNCTLADLDQAPIATDVIKTWIGNGSDVLVARGLSRNIQVDENLPAALLKKARFLFNEHYAQAGHHRDVVYPNVAETLKTLKQQGFELAVLTNKSDAFVEPILTAAEIMPYFSAWVGGQTLKEKKPSPMGLLHLAKQFNCQMTEIVMVGDSENDIKAAKAAGCLSAGLTYGYNYGVPISQSEPELVMDNLSALLASSWVNKPVLVG
ncbi:phosphoglycolate phosphatase [Catenovulum sp. SM1970]|uniref:phosphoglycolate phosphatase n=1 Tax=Marinifaba aquimaris TaxID=2741323 RepID=UPI001571D1BF|nr:phosphoglycolate phosphatase [Marinifaba aquimaris]NTS75539.1 phosphoglycolate phosphatase [Marinifaba aquimaris]